MFIILLLCFLNFLVPIFVQQFLNLLTFSANSLMYLIITEVSFPHQHTFRL
jgi:hypothetical protein